MFLFQFLGMGKIDWLVARTKVVGTCGQLRTGFMDYAEVVVLGYLYSSATYRTLTYREEDGSSLLQTRPVLPSTDFLQGILEVEPFRLNHTSRSGA